MADTTFTSKIICYHCGEDCPSGSVHIDDKYFCCLGCKTVYEILNEGNLCKYYEIDKTPGVSLKKVKPEQSRKNSYLDDPLVISKLLDFTDGKLAKISLFIPQIHCSSCIWLLENLYKLNKNIIHSEVNFLQKNVVIRFNITQVSLRQIVELLASVGYEPQINLGSIEHKNIIKVNRKLYYKLGIAGFCFGNIMLLSFPEYLSAENFVEHILKNYFGFLNIILALPVIFYSSSDYFKSAFAGLKQRNLNIDFPISLGLAVLFLRSVFEVVTNTGPGFFDSLSGLVFFLLIGKVFQGKTYDALNFERNYKSYFPLSVAVKKEGNEIIVPVSNIKQGDRIIIRNNELIPADAILFSPSADIDYSFVTGEAVPIGKVAGEIIYAGGRQIGPAVEMEVIRTVSQSYLTQLWNNEAFVKRDESRINSIVNTVGKYFTIVIILVAIAAALYWLPVSVKTAVNAFTAVLIIACPCGIALTNPFALGNAMRILGRNKFYLKNASVVEKLSRIDTVVFDKTGTITQTGSSEVSFIGSVLNSAELRLVKSLVHNSTHPLSSIIYEAINEDELFEVKDFCESVSKGLEGNIEGYKVRIGSALFIANGQNLLKYWDIPENKLNTRIFLSIDNHIKGYFSINNAYRVGLNNVISQLKKRYELSLVSGDNDTEKENLESYFGKDALLYFNHKPADKLNYIKLQQALNKKVLMIGDGLNDAGALQQSDVGVAISEDVTSFSPACDAILDASVFSRFSDFIKFAVTTRTIIIMSYAISVLYNVIGILLAFSSAVTPLMAAILMPVSSVTVVLFTVVSTNLAAKSKGLL